MAERTEEESRERRRKISVPKVRTILKQIGDDLTKGELEKLIFMAADHIPKGKTQDMGALNFFSALEERQIIDTKQDDVEYLVELLSNLPRADLAKKLKSPYTGSICTEKIVVHEVDAVMVTSVNTVKTSASCWYEKENKVNDGNFLQDPELMQSVFQNHNDTVSALEKALEAKVELRKKNHELQFEIDQMKDDQNNLIKERNSALGVKSEFVYRESELRKELSDLKQMNNLLGKNNAKANNVIDTKDKEIEELKKSLNESEKKLDELRSELETVKLEKLAVEEKLAKFQKDEEDHGRVTCKRCGLAYVEANNPVDACRYHSGHFGTVGAIKKKMEWSCCKNTNKNAPGCCKKKHLTIDYQLSPGLGDTGRKFTI